MAVKRGVTGINVSFKKLVAHCIIRTVLASIMAFILYASFSSIAVGMYTEEIGYTVLYSEDEQSYDTVYEHYYKDGEDKNLAKYEKDTRYYKTPIRSSLDDKKKQSVMWIAQIVSALVWFATIYSIMWSAGDSDANKAEFGDSKRDRLKGVKAALCAEIPFFVLFLMVALSEVIGKGKTIETVYEIFTYYSFTINNLFLPIQSITDVFGLLLGFLPLPLFAAFGYLMGEKHIVIRDKILYKKEQNNG